MKTNRSSPYNFLMLAALIIPALLFALIGWQDYKTTVRNAQQDVTRTTKIFEEHAQNVFETHQLIAERVNDRLEDMSWEEIGRATDISKYLENIEKEYPQVCGIWLADSSGVVRNASKKLPDMQINISDRDYFQALRKNNADNLFIGHIVKPRVMKNLIFNVVYRRGGEGGKFEGVIIVTADPEYFSDFWNSVTSKNDSAAVLLRSDGAVLSRSLGIDPARLTLPTDSQPMQEIKKTNEGSYISESVHDGTKRIFGFHKVDRFNAFIIYGVSMESVLLVWKSHLVPYGCFFSIAVLILVLFVLSSQKHAKKLQASESALIKLNGELDHLVEERTQELQEKNLLLIHQSRLAAMGEMIQNIAHQWRQPLNTLGLKIQSLPMFYEAGKVNKEFIDKTVSSTMSLVIHMSKTIDDFRDFFKPDKDKEEFNISQVIESAIQLVEASFQSHHIKIEVNCAAEAVATGYSSEYSQVILNILINAKDALLASKTDKPKVTITSCLEAGRTVVTISDNAGGIPENIIFKVFDPHFTTKGSQGTGIGLFMAKNIIERNMNGTLSVRNNNVGAVFRIEV
jgi:C4-dicarboxylate-specific signal transduction histidine kinase